MYENIASTLVTNEGKIAEESSHAIIKDRIIEEEMYDGFYRVCTNLESSIEGIIKINQRR